MVGRNLVRVRIACVASVSNLVIARKLERKQKKKGGRGSFFPLPLPRHSLFFFLLSSRRSRRTRAETLATQASVRNIVVTTIFDFMTVEDWGE